MLEVRPQSACAHILNSEFSHVTYGVGGEHSCTHNTHTHTHHCPHWLLPYSMHASNMQMRCACLLKSQERFCGHDHQLQKGETPQKMPPWVPGLARRADGAPRAGNGLLLRELLGRVKATVMGAVANAEVPMERALAAAGVPEGLWGRAATRCVVHDEGFFKVADSMDGFEARGWPAPAFPRMPSPGKVVRCQKVIQAKLILVLTLMFCSLEAQ